VLALVLLASCGGAESQTVADAPRHHLADGTFQNPPGSPHREFTTGEFLSFLWNRYTDFEDIEVPDGHVLNKAETLAGVRNAGNPSLTWLGHATFLIRLGGKVILTDPFLDDEAGPLWIGANRFAPPGLSVDELPPIDVILVSHNHYDHLDADTVEALPGKERITVIAPLGLAGLFRDWGYRDIRELDWHDETTIGDLTVRALPGIHFSRRGLFDRNETLWASYAIGSPSRRIWFSGDTGYGPVFEEIGRTAGPFDLALVSIGAYEPRTIMEGAHVTPEEAVDLVLDVRARQAIAMHWGTIRVTPEDPFEAPERFRAAAREKGFGEDNLWIMKIGETRGF
jgi:L-ascorbate metabolism protein UlaG (beta-lactamase superfamily)